MRIPFLDLQGQHAALKEEVEAAVLEVLRGGHYILGPNVASFENEFAAYLGSGHGIGVNSGSDALALSLRGLGVGSGDEVITTPFSYIAPAEAIHQMGAKIVFADIDPDTFNLDPGAVAEKLTPRTRAIIPVHLFGQAADMGGLQEVLGKTGISIIEDCAQAVGAEYRERRVGTCGEVGCFSFYPTKNLGADGDGGMIVTNNGETAKKLRMLRVHGIEKRYFHQLHGFNSRLDEVQAAILRIKLRHLDAWTARRQEIARLYEEGLKAVPIQLPKRPGRSHVFHVYAILTERRDELQIFLEKEGVPTIIYYPQPLHLQQVYDGLGFRRGQFPIAERVAEKILPLPMHPELEDAQVEYVIEKVGQFFTG